MKILTYLLLCFFLASCSTLNSDIQSKVKPSEILLFKLKPPPKGTTQAYALLPFNGQLVLKENCLYLKRTQNKKEVLFGIIWPWDFNLKTEGKSVTVVNGSQKHIANIGDQLTLGGAYTSRTKFIDEYNPCSGYKVKSVFVGHQ